MKKHWTWTRLVERFMEDRKAEGWADGTLEAGARWMKLFLLWCNERNLRTAAEVTSAHIEEYRQSLLCQRARASKFYTLRSVDQAMRTLRQFFSWATVRQHLLFSPTADLVLPRIETRVVQLTEDDVSQILDKAENGGTVSGLRDRALLETHYSGGVRRSECLRLRVEDVNLEGRTLRVIGPNGERLVPLDKALTATLERYLRDSRAHLACGKDTGELFLSNVGTPYRTGTLGQMVGRLTRRVGFRVTTHMLRHACAVHRLAAGEDAEDVQKRLGLQHRQSASGYTDIATAALKRKERTRNVAQERRRLTHFSSLTVDPPGETQDA